MNHFARRLRRHSDLARTAQLGVAAVLAFGLIAVAAWADPPRASFTFSPTNPVEGETVTFTSTSTDPDNDIESISWDLDDDSSSFNDGSGTTASKRYDCDEDDHNGGPPPCTISVRLRVEDRDVGDGGGDGDEEDGDEDEDVDIESRSFTVRANAAPVAAFSASPESPETGQPVTLTSTSSDPDGRPLTERWDTDGNGTYETAGTTDRKVTLSFSENEVRTVGLQVTDSGGTVRTTTRQITVRNRAPTASPPGGGPGTGGPGTGNAIGRRALVPFPSVRIRGMTTAKGARIDLLSVRTPGGVRILVRCKGNTCPYARRIRRARFAESRVRTIKLPGFNRRHVRAGTVIQIFVIDNGVIGKYTRFVIRRGLRAPKRVDRCAVPGKFRARSCPG